MFYSGGGRFLYCNNIDVKLEIERLSFSHVLNVCFVTLVVGFTIVMFAKSENNNPLGQDAQHCLLTTN